MFALNLHQPSSMSLEQPSSEPMLAAEQLYSAKMGDGGSAF